MSNKDNNHIVDTNKKISSVDWLIKKLINRQNGVFDGLPHLSLDEIFGQAKEMHKEETVEFTFNYFLENQNGEDIGQYYENTYGED